MLSWLHLDEHYMNWRKPQSKTYKIQIKLDIYKITAHTTYKACLYM